jgi:hypothetical protein
MKANGEVKDSSTVCLLTPKDCMNTTLHKGQECFLTSNDHWGQGTIVKDLGPDILNLAPNPEKYGPWKDQDRPAFPALNDKLAATKATGGYHIVGNLHKLAWVLPWKHGHEGQSVGTAH